MKLSPVTVHSPVYADDGYGNLYATGEWGTATTKGRVRPSSGREINRGGTRELIEAVGLLDPKAEVSEEDEITAGGKRYRVVGAFKVESHTGNLDHWRVDLQGVS